MDNEGIKPSADVTGSTLVPDGARSSWTSFRSRIIARFKPGAADNVAERTRRRVTLHLIPFLFFLYILAYLDRVNVSVAELAMEGDPESGGLGLTREMVGFGAGIFFWGYWILEIPSTVSVARWGARWVFVRILILWGLCAALIGFVGTPLVTGMLGWLPSWDVHFSLGSWPVYLGFHPSEAADQFYFLRFMLGFFEGGFFPSVIVYLSHWFRTEDRARSIASFMSAIPLSSMIGLPLSGLLLGVHWFNLAGWRWIFILEGVAPVLAGFATIFFLPDRPAVAAWLRPEEREWLEGELEREHQAKTGHGHGAWMTHLGMVLLLTFVYFCLNVTSYGLSMFMPNIIKTQSGASKQVASFLAALPYVMAFIGILINGWHSDRSGERILHVAIPLVLVSAGIWLAIVTDGMGAVPVLIMIFCVGTFVYAHLPAFWSIPTLFLGATTAAAAIGFINMIGNLGGSVGPMLVGKAAEGQTTFAPALWKLAPWPITAAVIILIVGYAHRSRTQPKP